MMKYIRWQAVLAGLCIDIVLTIVCSSLLLSVYGAGEFDSGMDQREIQSQMALLMAESNFIVLAFVVGMFCTAMGGFVAARMAYQVPLYHAALVGVLGIMLGAYIGTQWGFWEIAGLLFTLPVAILGGYLARAKIGNSK